MANRKDGIEVIPAFRITNFKVIAHSGDSITIRVPGLDLLVSEGDIDKLIRGLKRGDQTLRRRAAILKAGG